MTEDKDLQDDDPRPPKRQVARSNRAGSTTVPPAGLRLNFLDALITKGFPVEVRRLVDETLIESWREFFANEPPLDPKTVDSAHKPPTAAGRVLITEQTGEKRCWQPADLGPILFPEGV